MTKDEIRIRQKQLRNVLSAEEREELSKAIGVRLFQSEAYQSCEYIFPFVSFQSEVATGDMIRQFITDGKRVFVPRVEEKYMEFYEIQSLEGLILSHYGVPEPPKNDRNSFTRDLENIKNEKDFINIHDVKNKEDIKNNSIRTEEAATLYNKVMLLPGLAFDQTGNRIGYGAGYYDRYLASHSETGFYKIALAFDFQVIDHITADEFDRKADAILTPTQYIICK